MVLKKGSTGDSVLRLQRGLALLGFNPGKPDGVFGGKSEDAVESFQTSRGLYTDGIAGIHTIREYNKALRTLSADIILSLVPLEEDKAEPVDHGERQPWVDCPADKFSGRGGYLKTTLRADTAEAYNGLLVDVHSLGGIVTSAGGRRALSSKAGPNRSKTSMHYVGRAFDMAIPTGMQNPDRDPFLMSPVTGTRLWTVWCRSNLDPNLLVSRAQQFGVTAGIREVVATYLKNGEVTTKFVTAPVFDFTAMAMRHGFNPIPARKAFFDKGDAGAAEWWHWSWTTGLTGKTTFGAELLRVYSLAEAQKFVYWEEAKSAVYGVSWF